MQTQSLFMVGKVENLLIDPMQLVCVLKVEVNQSISLSFSLYLSHIHKSVSLALTTTHLILTSSSIEPNQAPEINSFYDNAQF